MIGCRLQGEKIPKDLQLVEHILQKILEVNFLFKWQQAGAVLN